MGKVQELKNFSVKKIELILAVIFISNRAQLKKKVYLGRLENKSRRKLEPKTVEVKKIKGWKQRQKNLRATQPIKLGSPHPPPSRPLLSFFSLGAFFVFEKIFRQCWHFDINLLQEIKRWWPVRYLCLGIQSSLRKPVKHLYPVPT